MTLRTRPLSEQYSRLREFSLVYSLYGYRGAVSMFSIDSDTDDSLPKLVLYCLSLARLTDFLFSPNYIGHGIAHLLSLWAFDFLSTRDHHNNLSYASLIYSHPLFRHTRITGGSRQWSGMAISSGLYGRPSPRHHHQALSLDYWSPFISLSVVASPVRRARVATLARSHAC